MSNFPRDPRGKAAKHDLDGIIREELQYHKNIVPIILGEMQRVIPRPIVGVEFGPLALELSTSGVSASAAQDFSTRCIFSPVSANVEKAAYANVGFDGKCSTGTETTLNAVAKVAGPVYVGLSWDMDELDAPEEN
jgi:hypothetical protein